MKRLILGLLGAFMGLIGMGLMGGGLALLAVFGTDGRAQVDLGSLESERGRAVVVTDFEISSSAPVPMDEDWFDLRLDVTSAQAVFVGVADQEDSLAYLRGVPYTLVTGIDSEARDADTTRIPGDTVPDDPQSEEFWSDSAAGSEVSVRWPVSDSATSLVVMNEDTSRGVGAEVAVDVTVTWAGPLGIGAAVAGLVLIVVGIVVLVLGLRSGRSSSGQTAAQYPGAVG